MTENKAIQNKERTAVWLYPQTMEGMDGSLTNANCKSRSEFIENALHFYMGFLDSQSAAPFLSQAILDAVQGTLQISEHRVSNNLFRLSVEMNMMMHLLATTLEVTDEELRSLRSHCVREVKNRKGRITIDDAIAFQQGDSSD